MEYTRSVGDVFETYRGTPQEIAELIMGVPESLTLEGLGFIDEQEESRDLSRIPKDILIRELRSRKGMETIEISAETECFLKHQYEEKESIASLGMGPMVLVKLRY